MSFNYNANQFDQQFQPKSLCNWEVPKWNPRAYPRQKTKVTRIIANDRGHLLPGRTNAGARNGTAAFTTFRGTYNLPEKILTKQEAFELNGVALQTPFAGPRWIKRGTAVAERQKQSNRKKSQSAKELRLLTRADSADQDLSYVPGQIVEPSIKTPDHLALEQLRLKEELIDPEDLGNKLYLEEHDCSKAGHNSAVVADQSGNMMKYNIADKPTETEDFFPFIPAYCNFETARMMSQDNLRHQPLPDAVVDTAFRTMQVNGEPYPGLALDVLPITTGVGVRNYKAGPTQCTKMRIYRPKTCGVMAKPLEKSDRPQSSIVVCDRKMGPMDLAICWDYRPFDPRDEPKPPTHIDGSNGSAAPALFAIVKTPRENPETAAATGRSTGALFANTLGQENFFDKDLLKRNREYNEKYSLERNCECGNLKEEQFNRESRPSVRHSAQQTSNSSRRSSSSSHRPKTTASRVVPGQNALQKSMYKSSPNLIAQLNESEKLLNSDPCQLVCISHRQQGMEHLQQYRSQPDLNYHPQKQRIPRECHNKSSAHKLPHAWNNNNKPELRPFKAGLPTRNSNSFDSGCGGMNDKSYHHQPQIRIPKPREPYAHKNYNIDTLAPPFACWKGGAGQGGYPEHWRLASVYQHAYKPIDQRRRPLLATVYQ